MHPPLHPLQHSSCLANPLHPPPPHPPLLHPSSFSFPLFLLILFVFILLVHPLSSSSSSLLCLPSSVTFLSTLPPNLHPPHSPSFLSFHSCYPFFILFPPLPPYSLLFPSSFVPELPLVLTLSSSTS